MTTIEITVGDVTVKVDSANPRTTTVYNVGVASPQAVIQRIEESERRAPRQDHVDELRALLDLMESFSSNDQRARYLLGSNFLRDHGAEIAERITASLVDLRARTANGGAR